MGPSRFESAFTCTVTPFAAIRCSSPTNSGMLDCTEGW